jgi:hypothetical protein
MKYQVKRHFDAKWQLAISRVPFPRLQAMVQTTLDTVSALLAGHVSGNYPRLALRRDSEPAMVVDHRRRRALLTHL